MPILHFHPLVEINPKVFDAFKSAVKNAAKAISDEPQTCVTLPIRNRNTPFKNCDNWLSRLLGSADSQRDINGKINAMKQPKSQTTGLHEDAHSLLTLAYQLKSNMCAITNALTEENIDDTSKQLAQGVKDEARMIVSPTKIVVDLVKVTKGASSQFTKDEKDAVVAANLAYEPIKAFDNSVGTSGAPAFHSAENGLESALDGFLKAAGDAKF